MKKFNLCGIVMILLSTLILTGCATVPQTIEARAVLSSEVDETIAVFKAKDPDIQRFIDNSYGYAVLPKVAKGAIWLGGAYGRGEVFEQGRQVGFCSVSQATLGFSFGGEFFREIIFFRGQTDMDRFKRGEYAFSAQITGVAATAGAAAKTDYRLGVVVFIATDVGLMVDASLGGQKFTYVPGITIEDMTK